jgi:putative transcriptional regulator
MTKKYKSKSMAVVHETASDFHNAGLMDGRTMKSFDKMCLTPVRELSPNQIKAIRHHERVSQNVFANFLYVTPGLVSQWERGKKRPRGASLKLLTLVKKKGLQAVA